MTLTRIGILALSLTLASAHGANAAPPIKPELQAAIAVAKLYDPAAVITEDTNRAIITVKMPSGRTQRVFFDGEVAGPIDAKNRLIYSVAASVSDPINPALALRLLQQNYIGLPYGSWSIGKLPSGALSIVYSVEVPANARASTIRAVVATVAARADTLELELTSKDQR